MAVVLTISICINLFQTFIIWLIVLGYKTEKEKWKNEHYDK